MVMTRVIRGCLIILMVTEEVHQQDTLHLADILPKVTHRQQLEAILLPRAIHRHLEDILLPVAILRQVATLHQAGTLPMLVVATHRHLVNTIPDPLMDIMEVQIQY